MRVVTFRCDDEVLQEIDRMSIILDRSRSQIIRDAILEYMSNHYSELPQKKPIKVFKRALR